MEAQGRKALSAGPHGTIRSLRRGDLAGLSALIQNTLLVSNSADYELEVIANLQRGFSARALRALSRHRRIFVYERDGKLAGTVSLEGNRIHALFVAPDMQGLGIGRALMMFAESVAREKGEGELVLAASLTAAGFYQRMGFTDPTPGGDETYGPILWMRKKL
jgi:GNAT superfamily N-acetyltransferase